MDMLVDLLFNFMEESNGVWVTNNDGIEGDLRDLDMFSDSKSIQMTHNDEDIKINYSDIISIVFQDFKDMIIAILKIKDIKPMLLHIMMGGEN